MTQNNLKSRISRLEKKKKEDNREWRTCLICGRHFQARINPKRHTKIYCSSTCKRRAKYQREESCEDGISVIYVATDASGLYKIGMTNDLVRRTKDHKISNPTYKNVLSFSTDKEGVYKIEIRLHKKYSKKRVSGEWFRLEEEDIEHIKLSFC